MERGRFTALAALGGAVVLAGWGAFALSDIGSGSTDAMDIETGGTTVIEKTRSPSIPAALGDDAVVAPVASARMVDAALLSPFPTPVPSEPPVLAALRQGDSVERSQGETTSSVPPPTARAEAKPAIVVPRLDRDGNLTVAEIARIKASLNLTPDQERHWVPVEVELREIIRQLAARKITTKRSKTALGADEVQRLYWAAGPFLMSLREDQKQQVRQIARAMGLERVAALI